MDRNNRDLSINDPQAAGTSGSAAEVPEDTEIDVPDAASCAPAAGLADVETSDAPPAASSASAAAPLAPQELFSSPSPQHNAPPGRMSRPRQRVSYQAPEAPRYREQRPATPNRPAMRRLANSIRLQEELDNAREVLVAPIHQPRNMRDERSYECEPEYDPHNVEVWLRQCLVDEFTHRPATPFASPTPSSAESSADDPTAVVRDADDDADGVNRLCCCARMCSLSGLARGCPDTGKSCIGCWCCCCTCTCNHPVDDASADENEAEKEPQQEPEVEEPLIPDEPPPTPPTMEEILAWGKSFDEVMRSTAGRKIFRDFLRGEYSEENIMFWLACEDLKRETEKDVIIQKSRFIYEDYISVLSPKEVSLDSAVREIVNLNMMEPRANCFDEAQLQIYTLMQRDSYPRFVNSALYKALVSLYDGSNANTSK